MTQGIEPACRIVLQLCRPQLGRQSVTAPLGGVGEQAALARHAEAGRDFGAVDEGPIVDDTRGIAAVLEAALFANRNEPQPTALARRKRMIECEDHIVKVSVVPDFVGAVDRQGPHFQIAIPAHMHLRERPAGTVLECEAALRPDLARMGTDIHVERDIREAGYQGNEFIAKAPFLIRPEIVFAHRGSIFVENVGIVIDEAAARREDDNSQPHNDFRRPAEPARQTREPGVSRVSAPRRHSP